MPRFENRNGARTTWKLIHFKCYFYLIKKILPCSFLCLPAQGPSQWCSEVISALGYGLLCLPCFAHNNLAPPREQLLADTYPFPSQGSRVVANISFHCPSLCRCQKLTSQLMCKGIWGGSLSISDDFKALWLPHFSTRFRPLFQVD